MLTKKTINTIKEKRDGVECLLFVRSGSPPCEVMKRTLGNLSKKLAFQLVCVDVSDKNCEDKVKKYKVGSLPKYVFLDGDDCLLDVVGTEAPYYLERQIKNFTFERE